MSLDELQTLLGGVPDGPLGPEALAALVARWPEGLDERALVARAGFSDQGYTRIVLHRGTEWEALLAGWLPGQRTAPHGHGESHGITCVLEGSLAEVEFRLARGGQVLRAERRKHGPGSVFQEEPHTIHQVEHAGRVRTVSLHLYAPPLRRMELYGSTGTSQPRESGRRDPKSSVIVR